MKKQLLPMFLLLLSQPAFARDMSPQEVVCLSQIRDETDFIISRINLIHSDYEKQLKQSALGKFKSGGYSTIGLLDNSIRKYHRKLVHKFKKYPFRYQAKIKAAHHSGGKRCLAEQLRTEAVGTIHEFEISWQKALEQAEKNASYFQQVDELK